MRDIPGQGRPKTTNKTCWTLRGKGRWKWDEDKAKE